MNEYLKTKAWDNFNWNLYLAYLEAKIAKEEQNKLNPKPNYKS